MKRLASIGTALVVLCLWGPARADQLPTSADAKSLGFSAAGLARIAPWYQARFDAFPPSEGLVPGAVVAIAKGGQLAYLQAIGFQDRAKTVPMKMNSIFWIASMTKPVTSVAAMILVDDGKLELDAPVARYLPEIGKMPVGTFDPATGQAGLTLQKRPMTVRDLLRHTSGVIAPELDFAFPERGLADATTESALRAIHMIYDWKVVYRREKTLADFVSSLADLPLVHQPGEVHEYGWSSDVLARVVEVASGQPLDQFMQTRIFAPLHMVDTGFFVPKEKLDRLVDSPMPERPPIWDVTTPARLFSGAGGLVSTAPDYLRFCQMVLNGGELDGVRVLTAQAVKQMTTNALPADVRIFGGNEVGARAGTTFGLGFGIRTSPIASWIPGAPGSFGWAGSWGTYFWVDPAEQLIGVEMIQATPGSKARAALASSGINHLTYGALAAAAPSAEAPPAVPAMTSAEALADYVGTYDFAGTVSSRDRQGVADGKNGWLGIEAFVAMEQDGLRINRPDPGSPATKAGVATGDLVTELDGASLKGLALADVLSRLRGPANTTLKIKIVHRGQDGASDLTLVRAARRANTVQLQVRVVQDRLVAEAVGMWPILAFEKSKAVPLVAASNSEFSVADDGHTRIAFVRDPVGKVSGLVLDPGPWELKAAMIAAGPK
ncbi:CubicO group peptidase (beta-lactamase class C family) [Bradyrhizobium macuxiense]|uniref:CubicO group peptidase (Beta-lactamase class C family) n=1 Tax=Bradyrhizobium macuxiense TaxID=1755647 RepID=A0A560MBX5_9BRAD|nr:serine hydrolase [Bradyrhizobium macuxiense]TWC05119.1 CubicO group peptidase (beta-lactamase class C family) [Bradyrhizobium macuxiense]